MKLVIKKYESEISAELMRLLLAADPNPQRIESYILDSTVLVASLDSIVGVAVIIGEQDVFEVMNLAVDKLHQGKGFAKSLITDSKLLAKRQGAEHLQVTTGNSSLSQLALYQKCGFRMVGIEPDYFLRYDKPIFENGIRCIDKVILRVQL